MKQSSLLFLPNPLFHRTRCKLRRAKRRSVNFVLCLKSLDEFFRGLHQNIASKPHRVIHFRISLEGNQVELLTKLVLVVYNTANFIVRIFSKLVRQVPGLLEVLEITLKIGF